MYVYLCIEPLMLESEIEKCLVRLVEEHGGITAKMTIKGRRGWPDRLVIMPYGVMALVEVKRPKKSGLTPTQRALYARLAKIGQPVYVPRTIKDVVVLVSNLGKLSHAQREREAEARDAGRRARKIKPGDSDQRRKRVREGGREEGASCTKEGEAKVMDPGLCR